MNTASPPPLLDLQGISKTFPGCCANDAIDLTVGVGEIHALLGENGAGKSTLVKIIYGLLKADEGHIHWNGEPVEIQNPSAARRLGIAMVFQHFSLFESLTVLENIALGMDQKTDLQALQARFHELCQNYGLPLDSQRYVHTLSVGERQRIEIIRCLLQNPQLLIMDEPTSVLTPQEAEKLFITLRRLSDEGVSILYISHKLDEIKALCQTATILRLGRRVAATDPRQETVQSLATLMMGSELVRPASKTTTLGAARLVARNLHLPAEDGDSSCVALKGINLQVHAGEIFGIAGVAGNGQIELLKVLSGEILAPDADCIRLDDFPCGNLGAGQRRSRGLCCIPEERLGHSAVPGMSLEENAFLTAHRRMDMLGTVLVNFAVRNAFARQIIADYNVKCASGTATAASLSGGNLQKFIIGREILQKPDVLVVSQPTWGVDAGAASTIHQMLLNLASAGSAVLIISQDIDELIAISDRVAAICAGELSAAKPTGEVSINELGLLMGGVHRQENHHA